MAEAPSLVGYHHVVNATEMLADANMRLVPVAIRRNWEARVDSEIGRVVPRILSPIVLLPAENVRVLHEEARMGSTAGPHA